jgi:gluconolactonase
LLLYKINIMTKSAIQSFDRRWTNRYSGATLEKLAQGAVWGEGPVWMHEDDSILWSDIPNNRMLRWSAKDGQTLWRSPADFTNGHTREADGSLLHCSHGARAIIRTRFGPNLTSPIDEIVVNSYRGKRLNSPNDVVVKSDGTIWFTDPPYGILSNNEGYAAESEIGKCHVFCFNPKTSSLTAVTDYLVHPNGLAFSPDEQRLYVSDTSAVLDDKNGFHHIVVFDVIEDTSKDATIVNPRTFATITPGLPDGFRVNHDGWLFTSSLDSVQVYHADGTRLATIAIPEKIGNLTFKGENHDILYVVASSSLYRVSLIAT